jgi:hypothetical protein
LSGLQTQIDNIEIPNYDQQINEINITIANMTSNHSFHDYIAGTITYKMGNATGCYMFAKDSVSSITTEIWISNLIPTIYSQDVLSTDTFRTFFQVQADGAYVSACFSDLNFEPLDTLNEIPNSTSILTGLQTQIDNLEIPNYDQEISDLKEELEAILIRNYDHDINDLH